MNIKYTPWISKNYILYLICVILAITFNTPESYIYALLAIILLSFKNFGKIRLRWPPRSSGEVYMDYTDPF